uniref:Uncharacterized protein n=1 Tax=Anopheles minimus TaxID=112268 RepID=A0A182W699_9DIPT
MYPQKKFRDGHRDLEMEICKLITELLGGLGTRFEAMKDNKFITKAILLDPRLKKHAFENELKLFQLTCRDIISEFVPFALK